MRRALRCRKGQVVIPMLFVLPSLFLFVYLLMETTTLSREKIRRQFALDVAASQEMTLYSDLLNRLAYINGPFPDRVFQELAVSPVRYRQDYQIGMFPASLGQVRDSQSRWRIRFGPGRDFLNVENPPTRLGIYFINQEHVSPRMAVFTKVYYMLGDLADSHIKVFEGAISRNAQLRKAYWLNVGESPECPAPAGCAGEATGPFPSLPVTIHYLDGYEDNDDDEKIIYPPPGLFQLATVSRGKIQELRRGFEVRQSWPPPGNYFGVEFPTPHVRSFVLIDGGRVWPDPTPKFHARLQP